MALLLFLTPMVLTATVPPCGSPSKQNMLIDSSDHCRVGTTVRPMRCQNAPSARDRYRFHNCMGTGMSVYRLKSGVST